MAKTKQSSTQRKRNKILSSNLKKLNIRALHRKLKSRSGRGSLVFKQTTGNRTEFYLQHKTRRVGGAKIKAYKPKFAGKNREPFWRPQESSYWLGLNVHPNYRGKGYGTKIYQSATKIIPYNSGLAAFIENKNTPSIRAAKRAGFKKTKFQESKKYSSYVYHKVRRIKK